MGVYAKYRASGSFCLPGGKPEYKGQRSFFVENLAIVIVAGA